MSGDSAMTLVVLKLAGVIDWPWLAVLTPILEPLAVAGATIAVCLVVWAVGEVRRRFRDRK